jgi:hypothetical protein
MHQADADHLLAVSLEPAPKILSARGGIRVCQF